MKQLRIRLYLPAFEQAQAFDSNFDSGAGFRWADVEYEENPIGSKPWYTITKCTSKGKEIDLSVVQALNAPDCVDEAISTKVNGGFAHLSAPATKTGRASGPSKPQVIPAELDLGELFPV